MLYADDLPLVSELFVYLHEIRKAWNQIGVKGCYEDNNYNFL